MKHNIFFDNFLSEAVNLNQARLDLLTTRVNAVTRFLAKNLDSFIGIEPQGSYGLKTIIRPVKEGQEFDADIQLFMKYDPDKEPEDYIEELHNCFLGSSTYKDMVDCSTRCVCLDYAGDFHLDVVPCVTKPDGSKWVCNNKTNEFERTDGTGYRDWFNEKTRITHGNLKRVTRLLKFLRDHKGNFTAKSILLTTLIGMTVGGEDDGEYFKSVPDALKTVSNRINDFLQSHPTMPTILNPVLPEEDFNRHWDQAKYENFREKFAIYNEKINDAYDATEHNDSVDKWRAVFGDDFGEKRDEDDSKSRGRNAKGSGVPAVVSVKPRPPWASDTGTPVLDRPNGEPFKKTCPMTIVERDLEWLKVNHPNLKYNVLQHRLVGELNFCAEYDKTTELLTIGDKPSVKNLQTHLCDAFEIEMRMDPDSTMANGWPRVYEIGGRYTKIAQKTNVPSVDLHFYNDGACCLGINYFPERNLTLGRFVNGLVVPFFYRLSYTDRFGIDAARSDLWPEYSHGEKGHREYREDMLAISSNTGRNDPCLCGSGLKYKRCCIGKALFEGGTYT